MTAKNEGVNSFIDKALAVEKTDNVFKNLDARYDDIEELLDRGWTHAEFVEGLNAEGTDINIDTFRTYLYRMRSKRKNGQPKVENSSPPDRVIPASAANSTKPKPKKTAKPKPRKKSGIPDYEECPYILKIEAHLGERLPDSIRPYIKIVDGKPVTSFEKGTLRTADTREYMRRIWNVCEQNVSMVS